MHIVKSYQTAVALFCRDGSVWHYPSLKAARKALGLSWISNNVAEHFRTYSHTVWRDANGTRTYYGYSDEEQSYPERFYREANYVMRDDAGRPVMHSSFYATFPRPPRPQPRYRRNSARRFWNGEGAVPGTAKRRGGYHRGREIRYVNAKRAAETFTEEGEVAPRPKRGKTLLPDRWDGYPVSARRDHSWKAYRKTQWK